MKKHSKKVIWNIFPETCMIFDTTFKKLNWQRILCRWPILSHHIKQLLCKHGEVGIDMHISYFVNAVVSQSDYRCMHTIPDQVNRVSCIIAHICGCDSVQTWNVWRPFTFHHYVVCMFDIGVGRLCPDQVTGMHIMIWVFVHTFKG